MQSNLGGTKEFRTKKKARFGGSCASPLKKSYNSGSRKKNTFLEAGAPDGLAWEGTPGRRGKFWLWKVLKKKKNLQIPNIKKQEFVENNGSRYRSPGTNGGGTGGWGQDIRCCLGGRGGAPPKSREVPGFLQRQKKTTTLKRVSTKTKICSTPVQSEGGLGKPPEGWEKKTTLQILKRGKQRTLHRGGRKASRREVPWFPWGGNPKM